MGTDFWPPLYIILVITIIVDSANDIPSLASKMERLLRLGTGRILFLFDNSINYYIILYKSSVTFQPCKITMTLF